MSSNAEKRELMRILANASVRGPVPVGAPPPRGTPDTRKYMGYYLNEEGRPQHGEIPIGATCVDVQYLPDEQKMITVIGIMSVTGMLPPPPGIDVAPRIVQDPPEGGCSIQ